MEYCHQQVMLYRDLRTIKTRRYFENCAVCHQQDQPCHHPANCKKRLQEARNHRTSVRFQSKDRPQGLSTSDDALSIQGVSNSSLNSNCHNQYCSKSKRLLYQTEVQCGCDGVGHSDTKKMMMMSKSRLVKKFPTVLLLGTYLFLVTFPYASALPTTISSRPQTFWNSRNLLSVPKDPSQSKMNTTSLTHAFRSAKSAAIRALDLKRKFRDELDSDPEVIYKSTPNYDWLPNVPAVSNCTDCTDHLSSLELQQAMSNLLSYVKTIRVAVSQLAIDFQDDTIWGANFSSMRGSLDNIIDDLGTTAYDNKLTMTTMPDGFKNLNKTDRALRDWLIIRCLVDVLNYTVAVFEHFHIPYSD